MIKVILYITILLPGLILAQKPDSIFVKPDSVSFNNLQKDSLAVSDSTKRKKKQFDVNAVINATASDSLIFKVKEKKMELYGNGEMKYKQTDLKSANIIVNFQTNQIAASGVPDTADKSGKKLMGTPVLTEASETYEGTNLTYNFKTQQGFISLAKTKSEGTYYGGSKVKKMDKETYFVQNGMYTTCTDDTPHYNFYASEMKVIMKEQIIAKWIWLYIGGVPLPIPLPFGAFPTQSGRRSGIIAPAYGQSEKQGWYLTHLGYFWAMSDYMDLNGTMDYFFKGGFSLNSRFRYAKRYSLSGSIDAGYKNLHFGETGDPGYKTQRDWSLSINHNQVIDPTMRLDAHLTFMSSKNFINNNSINYDDLLTQNIVSSATLFKTWEESGNSLSLSYSRNQYLSTGQIDEILPNLTFTLSQSYPFKRKGKVDASDQKWYELLGYSYSGRFLNRRNKTAGNLNIRGGIQHDVGISVSPKIGYINISPRVSYTERWYNKRIEKSIGPVPIYNSANVITGYKNDVISKDINEINMVRDFDFSISASTRLYGIIQPNALGIDALRHTITPSISYNYTPDFSKPKWGYYDSYKDTNGKQIKYSKFEKEVFTGPGEGESQSLSFSVGNIFEMKTKKDPTDTTSEAKKIQLLNFDASVGYNFAADSMRLSDLHLGYRTQVADFLNFSGGSTYSFYDYALNKNGSLQKINKFLINEKKGLLKLTNFDFSISASLSGEKLKSKETKEEKKKLEENEVTNKQSNYSGIYNEEDPDFEIPWDVSLSYNYRFDNIGHTKSSNVNLNLNTNLTKSWKLSLSAYYDIFRKEFQAPQINIYKDLHCWELKITWNPLGTYRGYRFEIRIKAPQLQDIKVTRRRGQFQGVGY
ncbi:MAG: putative LPS assembly protein LptD [Ignavibacteriales bacterium]|nr:putative LPS assembly protein LptD [Ignavibacteriales bacterium]